MPPVVCVGDNHSCPMQTPTPGGPIPHAIGPIVGPGAATVLMGNKPPALVGDQVMCVTPGGPAPIDAIAKGSATVLVCNKPVARVGDMTAHGGTLMPPGVPTVMIGG